MKDAVRPCLLWIAAVHRSVHRLVRRVWERDQLVVRWGLPGGAVALGLGLGLLSFGTGPSLRALQAQLEELHHRHALQRTQWQSEDALREQASALEDSFLAWQSALRWQQPSPWLHWPEHAQAFGVTVERIQAAHVQVSKHHIEHRIVLEGQGQLADVDAWWRALGQQGWWITVQGMRMQVSPTAPASWQAQWVVHEGLPADAVLAAKPVKGAFAKTQWAQAWLREGAPSIAQVHAQVSVAPEWPVSAGSVDHAVETNVVMAKPSSWPKTEWTDMRWVGRWMRGQQVLALVAVQGEVHAVVPGMRLGPEQQEVVAVTWDGVWVVDVQGERRLQRVLSWTHEAIGEGS